MSIAKYISEIEKHYEEHKVECPDFKSGDTIEVTCEYEDGKKKTLQKFEGVVIQIKRSIDTSCFTFTVRKISNGVAIEKIFNIISPNIKSIKLKRRGDVRRARLYYIRDKKGKEANIKQKMVKNVKTNE